MTHSKDEAAQPKRWQEFIARFWLAIVAVGGFVLLLLSAIGVFTTATWVDTVIAAIVALGVTMKAFLPKVERLTGIDVDKDNTEG